VGQPINPAEGAQQRDAPLGWADLLAGYPPGHKAHVPDLAQPSPVSRGEWYLATPDLELHCDAETCKGTRLFACCDPPDDWLEPGKMSEAFLDYKCKNCGEGRKVFAVLAELDPSPPSGAAIKLGEHPPFGDPLPPGVNHLVGPDRELFLQGRRAEQQTFGIGAFAYYRQVVESQKDRLFDRIVAAAKRAGVQGATLRDLEAAKVNFQFNKGMEEFKQLIPDSLLIDGHNPLALLHKALSQGLHNKSDSECLQLAMTIRSVLCEMARRISHVLKENAEVKQALSYLMGGHQTPPITKGRQRPQ